MCPVLIVDGNPEREGLSSALADLAHWAARQNHHLALPAMLKDFVRREDRSRRDTTFFDTVGEAEAIWLEQQKAGLLISMGGDGSVLHAVGRFWALDLPVLGVNLGSVGFNAAVVPEQFVETLDAWVAGRTRIVEHMLMNARHLRGGEVIGESIILNEMTLHREPFARILQFELHQGESLVLACYGDGLIVSTPTGSTAYNLSAGGPIVHPAVEAFVVSTLGAHTLAGRPIVLATRPGLRLIWRARPSSDAPIIMLDGFKRWMMREGDEVELTRAEQKLRLVKPAGTDYFETLRRKLNWSIPIRSLDPGEDREPS